MSMYEPEKPYKHGLVTLIESTWRTPYVTVTRGVYPIIRKRFSGLEIQHTDGIGTKGIYHWRRKTFANAVVDALAMNLNDLALVGAIPYMLQDHITMPDMGSRTAMKIIQALVRECKKRTIAIVGGETSHHNNVDAVDISMTVSGLITVPRKNRLMIGDVLIGLPSNGLHSNGFTKVRGMFGSDEWRPDFVRPTIIYLDSIMRLLKHCTIHGMMHITGGAFTKLKDILTESLDVTIDHSHSPRPQPIFFELYERGVSSREMYTTFNCGIGFVLSSPEAEVKKILRFMRGARIIGRVAKGKGRVHIQSAFDGSSVEL